MSTRTKKLSLLEIIRTLQNIQIGGKSGPGGVKMPRKDLAFVLSNLATLVDNGVSLRKAIATIRDEDSLQRYSSMLDTIQQKLESGESFSSAIACYPATFDTLIVHQIRVGERSGTIPETLVRIVRQVEKGNKLRSTIIKRLSYPGIVTLAGSGVITFMILYIIPVFQKTYAKAKVPLPGITQFLIGVSEAFYAWGWMMPFVAVGLFLGLKRMRRNPNIAGRMDAALLKAPVIGGWLRDIAVLQFMNVLGTMMDSGFKIVDALGVSADSVGNVAVRRAVEDLRTAVVRGERFSNRMTRHRDLFPPVVSQLVIIGEQTGRLADTTKHIRQHLEQQIERKTDIAVGTIEPVLTISMAVAIGVILLAVYLPMFDMINVMDQ